MPPPAKCGARIEPWRARPVPFWRHGLLPPPRTLPRVFVDAVPWRRALSSARTHSCTSGPSARARRRGGGGGRGAGGGGGRRRARLLARGGPVEARAERDVVERHDRGAA